VDQWPLTGEKTVVATALVEEQKMLWHIEPTNSPWNTLIFVIRKKVRTTEAPTGFKSYQQSNAANGSAQVWLSLTHSYSTRLLSLHLDLKDAFFDISIHSKTEKSLLSLYHHQDIRALGADFIGQCFPKAWLTVPICVRTLLLQ
jgi:hypothetical protein